MEVRILGPIELESAGHVVALRGQAERHFAALLACLPNETLLKSELTNLTRYPIRRLDLTIENLSITDYRDELEASPDGRSIKQIMKVDMERRKTRWARPFSRPGAQD